jgi:hypothetical protein
MRSASRRCLGGHISISDWQMRYALDPLNVYFVVYCVARLCESLCKCCRAGGLSAHGITDQYAVRNALCGLHAQLGVSSTLTCGSGKGYKRYKGGGAVRACARFRGDFVLEGSRLSFAKSWFGDDDNIRKRRCCSCACASCHFV